MIHPPARLPTAVLAAGVLLAGCSTSDPTGAGSTGTPSDSAPASASASASPSPTSTLTAEEQQAFTEATEAVLAYRQTITDLFSRASTRLNDMNNVAAGEEVLDKGLVELQQSLSDGWRSEPRGVQLRIVSAEPLALKLGQEPDSVVIRACVDSTAVIGVSPDGTRTPGARERSDYTVTRTTYLPAPGWAVTRIRVASVPEEREC
jgi:hypothetical protein